MLENLQRERQRLVLSKYGELALAMTEDGAITIPVLVRRSRGDEVDVACPDAGGQCRRARGVECILLLGGAPGGSLAVVDPEHAGELVHVPDLQQAYAVASWVGKEAVHRGAAGQPCPEDGSIRQHQFPQKLKVVLPRGITVPLQSSLALAFKQPNKDKATTCQQWF